MDPTKGLPLGLLRLVTNNYRCISDENNEVKRLLKMNDAKRFLDSGVLGYQHEQ